MSASASGGNPAARAAITTAPGATRSGFRAPVLRGPGLLNSQTSPTGQAPSRSGPSVGVHFGREQVAPTVIAPREAPGAPILPPATTPAPAKPAWKPAAESCTYTSTTVPA